MPVVTELAHPAPKVQGQNPFTQKLQPCPGPPALRLAAGHQLAWSLEPGAWKGFPLACAGDAFPQPSPIYINAAFNSQTCLWTTAMSPSVEGAWAALNPVGAARLCLPELPGAAGPVLGGS